MAKNPLRGTVPATVRKWYYLTVSGLVIAAGAIQAGLEAGNEPTPNWLKVVKGSLLYLGGGGTILAASNVTRTDDSDGGDTPDDPSVDPTPPGGNP